MTNTKEQYYIEVWNKVLEYLQINYQLDSVIINSYYRKCYIHQLTADKCVIVSDNEISKKIMQQGSEQLVYAFLEVLQMNQPPLVEIYLENDLPSDESLLKKVVAFNSDADFLSLPIQTDRTFDNFIVGDCNKESQAAALACAINPGKFFNPLFIYGNSGLGKTHLLMSIANYVMKNDPSKNVYYTESLKFVETVVNAIRDNRIDEFKHYMYNVDLLLIDDIQFLAGKEKSHEIFFSIYNELVNNKKQVCIASDRQPREIKGLEDRLISRFSSGLSVGIDSPEFETSLAILQSKIKQNGYGIDDVNQEGLAYIASNFSGNVRDLEGAWNRVLFYAIEFQPDGGCIKFETVMNALKNQAVVSDINGLGPKAIIKAVADYYGLTRQQITSKTRTKNISNARQISIYLCRKLLDIPYAKLGDEFGGRDHSTIITAYSKVEQQIKKDETFKNAVEEIEKQLS